MFSTCPFVRPLPHLWTRYFERLCVFGRRTRTRTRTLYIRRTLCRHVTIGTVLTVLWLFLTVFWRFWRLVHCWYTVGPTVYQQCTNTLTRTMCRPCLRKDWYTVGTLLDQQCTNSVPIVKNSQKVKRQSKHQKWPLVYQLSHVYTESAEYTKSAFASESAEHTKPFEKEWTIF